MWGEVYVCICARKGSASRSASCFAHAAFSSGTASATDSTALTRFSKRDCSSFLIFVLRSSGNQAVATVSIQSYMHGIPAVSDDAAASVAPMWTQVLSKRIPQILLRAVVQAHVDVSTIHRAAPFKSMLRHPQQSPRPHVQVSSHMTSQLLRLLGRSTSP
jgi:hypothetical protein